MKSKLKVLAAVIFGVVFVGVPVQTASAEYSCESSKDPGCYGTVDYAFIVRQLPDSIGNYNTDGGYPSMLADAPQYYYQDRCGMENRTSESYAVFKYMNGHNDGIYFCPFLDISADQWVDYAQAHAEQGYVVSDTPVVGSIAIMNIGPRGHAAYVEEILDTGKIRVSQYDLLPGSYSESTLKAQNVKFLVNSPKGMKGA